MYGDRWRMWDNTFTQWSHFFSVVVCSGSHNQAPQTRRLKWQLCERSSGACVMCRPNRVDLKRVLACVWTALLCTSRNFHGYVCNLGEGTRKGAQKEDCSVLYTSPGKIWAPNMIWFTLNYFLIPNNHAGTYSINMNFGKRHELIP